LKTHPVQSHIIMWVRKHPLAVVLIICHSTNFCSMPFNQQHAILGQITSTDMYWASMLLKTRITHERNIYMIQKLHFWQWMTFVVLRRAMYDDSALLLESEPGWPSPLPISLLFSKASLARWTADLDRPQKVAVPRMGALWIVTIRPLSARSYYIANIVSSRKFRICGREHRLEYH